MKSNHSSDYVIDYLKTEYLHLLIGSDIHLKISEGYFMDEIIEDMTNTPLPW